MSLCVELRNHKGFARFTAPHRHPLRVRPPRTIIVDRHHIQVLSGCPEYIRQAKCPSVKPWAETKMVQVVFTNRICCNAKVSVQSIFEKSPPVCIGYVFWRCFFSLPFIEPFLGCLRSRTEGPDCSYQAAGTCPAYQRQLASHYPKNVLSATGRLWLLKAA